MSPNFLICFSKFPTGPASYASNCIIDLASKIRYCRYQIFLTFRSPTFPTLKPMADPTNCLPLTPDSIREVHSIIKPHIHSTLVLTCVSLDRIASNPSRPGALAPRFRLFFKCENFQRTGAFKVRGAFYALKHLIKELSIEEVKRRGVVTNSSGMAIYSRRADLVG